MARRPSPHTTINSRKVPKPLGMSSHAVRVASVSELLYVSGQIALEVPSGKAFNGDVKRQTELAMTHVRNIVMDSGFSMDEVLKVTLYMTDVSQLEKIEPIYAKAFVGQNLPARSVVQVAALPHGVAIQIDAVAAKGAKPVEAQTEDLV